MKNQLNIPARLIAVLALCAALSACSQPASAPLARNFPSTPAATLSSPFTPYTIMDY